MAQTLASARFVLCAGAWIEAVAVAVDAVEYDRRIFVEDVLRAVAVVHVPVDDQDARQTMNRFGMVGGKGDVVEKTKPHAAILRGVVPWRPDQAECAVVIAI